MTRQGQANPDVGTAMLAVVLGMGLVGLIWVWGWD